MLTMLDERLKAMLIKVESHSAYRISESLQTVHNQGIVLQAMMADLIAGRVGDVDSSEYVDAVTEYCDAVEAELS